MNSRSGESKLLTPFGQLGCRSHRHLAPRLPANPENCYYPCQFQGSFGESQCLPPILADRFDSCATCSCGWTGLNELFGINATPISTPAPGPAFYVAPPPLGDDSNAGTDAVPFATLDRARTAVRVINRSMSSDITVYLHSGKYELAQTISFDQNDSGANGFHVIYRNYPGEVPVITGGRRVVDWTRTTNGIFKASAQNLQFRQLYVNGVAAERARAPGSDSYYRLQSWDASSRTLVIEKDKISDWANLNQVEMHVLMSWTVNVFRIASYSISGDYAIIVPMEPERTLMFPNNSVSWYLQQPNEPYYFENAMEFLVSPGIWESCSDTERARMSQCLGRLV